MLKRRQKAFGFDNRLGNHPTKARIRTKPDAHPVSSPMYGTSPAKKEFIEGQLKTWFEQGVIEPSVSPWGAPVVVIYRNGKPRL
ncbi:hypothetical protein SISSUDRAFT_958962, partial [Sistotremastrum suecicum HHB10207 ss-3]